MDRSRDASAESIGQGEGQRLLHRKIVRPPGRISETKSALVGPDPLQESEGEGQMTITTRWLYSVDGQAKYYQDGDYIYSKNGQCEFSVSNGRWYAIKGGAAEYYVSDNWVHSRDGKAMFHFG